MHRKFTALVLATIVLLAVACGGDDVAATESLPDSTTRYTTDELQSALISLDDLPNGWANFEREDDDDDPICNEPDILTTAQTDGYRADGSYSQAMLGPFLLHTIVSLTEADAIDTLDTLRERWDCGEYSNPDGTTFTVQEIQFDDLGDETVAYRLQSSSDEQFPIQADYVFTRVGGVISGLAYAGVLGVQFDDVEAYAQLAAEKISAL